MKRSRRGTRSRKTGRGTAPGAVETLGVADMRRVSTLLVFSVAALVALGVVMLYSASMSEKGAHLLIKQSQWLALGLVAGVTMALIDYRLLRKYSWVLLLIAIVLLAMVLIPGIGHKIGGARRWFKFAGVSFQPSEFAKLALIIWVAYYCGWQNQKIRGFVHGIILPSLGIGLVLALICIEPDRGTTILMAAVCASMLFIGGVRLRYLLLPVLLGAGGIAWLLYNDPLRMKRIMSWLYPEEYKLTTGYQAWQAMVALGSGGIYGVGLGDGRQKLGFVPEQQTDFILSVIGEELGLIATLSVVVGFLMIAFCGMAIAWRARDRFGYYLATGITLLISLQACINIGVVTSALPNKGLALPFISYGGSNLLIMMSCIGVLISVARYATDEVVPMDELSADTVFLAAAKS